MAGFSLLASFQELSSVQLQYACVTVKDRQWSVQTRDLKANLTVLQKERVRTTAKLLTARTPLLSVNYDLHFCTIGQAGLPLEICTAAVDSGVGQDTANCRLAGCYIVYSRGTVDQGC